jgi:hypothetical protein
LSNPANCCLRLRFIRLSSLYVGVWAVRGLGWFRVLASLTVISIVLSLPILQSHIQPPTLYYLKYLNSFGVLKGGGAER